MKTLTTFLSGSTRQTLLVVQSMLLACALFLAHGSFAQSPDQAPELFMDSIQVNINQASAEVLADALDGIGLSKAQAIVSYREENGEFSSLDELKLVRGIGDATVRVNEKRILFE